MYPFHLQLHLYLNFSPENPIVAASKNFLTLTGYAMDDIIGKLSNSH